MGRILFFVALAAVVMWWLFGRKPRRPPDGRGPARPGMGSAAVDDMVACAHCGVHLPRADAVAEGADLYCGDEHRRLGRRGT